MLTDTVKITLPKIEDISRDCWTKLSQLRIFFGHQSVGYNIFDGIMDVMEEHDYIDLNLVETRNVQQFSKPVFAHSQVGRNTDPISKIQDFVDIMDSGIGENADIVFFKFCYVDIFRDSNPDEVFSNYVSALDGLKDRYPRTEFLHVTVPIRSLPKSAVSGLKQSIKSLVGQPNILTDNFVRDCYNKLLTDNYCDKEPVFDLALCESINPDGLRCYVKKGSQKMHVMAPEYTDDGGHLNCVGRRKVAEQLLVVLAGIADKR